MAKLALKQEPSPTPARQSLAAAIERSSTAQQDVSRLLALVDAAEASVQVAEKNHQQAKDDLSAVRENQAQLHEAALSQGHPPGRDDSVQEAKRLESEREEEVGTASSSLQVIRQKLENTRLSADQARNEVTLAARAVLADEIEPYFRETERMQSELIERRLILGFAASGLNSSSGEVPQSPIWNEIRNFTNLAIPVEYYSSQYVYPQLAPWRDALAALQADAAAPLPTSVPT
jgi:hypothetical protein